jgi:hypothetical protein
MSATARRSVRRTALLTALLAVTVVAGCSSSSNTSTTTMSMPAGGIHKPVATTDSDWKPVTDTLGRTGKFGDNNTV